MLHTVGDIMTTEVVVIDVLASLEEAESLMEQREVRRLPVVDEDGELAGILSRGDVREATSVESASAPNPYAPEADEDWLTVWEAMTRDLITVTPDTSLPDAVELMLKHKIGCLPVVAAPSGPGRRQLIGIVTDTDIFRLVMQIWREQEHQQEAPS